VAPAVVFVRAARAEALAARPPAGAGAKPCHASTADGQRGISPKRRPVSPVTFLDGDRSGDDLAAFLTHRGTTPGSSPTNTNRVPVAADAGTNLLANGRHPRPGRGAFTGQSERGCCTMLADLSHFHGLFSLANVTLIAGEVVSKTLLSCR